jgi:two-component system CheB/CheR fusion protein
MTMNAVAGHEILIVEDDPEMRELLELLLIEAGHRTAKAADGPGALDLIEHGSAKPDLLLSDYNLPGGMNGVMVATRVREKLGRSIPVVILTGDISTDSMQNISIQHCVRLKKPIKFEDLTEVIQNFLTAPPPPSPAPTSDPAAESTVEPSLASRSPKAAPIPDSGPDTIFIVDDDPNVREALGAVLQDDGHPVRTFANCEEFLQSYHSGQGALLLIDGYLPGMSGLALLQRLQGEGGGLPAIMITGNSDVHMAVEAMKADARDFIEKPIGGAELTASVNRALEQSKDSHKRAVWQEEAVAHMMGLTPQQRRVMELVLAGNPSKNIAADLGISQRTVENHRAQIMKRTGAKSLPALARLAMAAGEREIAIPSPMGTGERSPD